MPTSKLPDRVCNDKVMEDTIANTGESKALIDHVVKFQQDFIGRKMKEGSFESVRIEHFGLFRAKLKHIQWRDFMRSLPQFYRDIILKSKRRER